MEWRATIDRLADISVSKIKFAVYHDHAVPVAPQSKREQQAHIAVVRDSNFIEPALWRPVR